MATELFPIPLGTRWWWKWIEFNNLYFIRCVPCRLINCTAMSINCNRINSLLPARWTHSLPSLPPCQHSPPCLFCCFLSHDDMVLHGGGGRETEALLYLLAVSSSVSSGSNPRLNLPRPRSLIPDRDSPPTPDSQTTRTLSKPETINPCKPMGCIMSPCDWNSSHT